MDALRFYKYASPTDFAAFAFFARQKIQTPIAPIIQPKLALAVLVAGSLLVSAPVPVAVFGVASKTAGQTEWFHPSADCPYPQHIARPTSIKIIPNVSHYSTRCELGQLALR